MFRLQPDDVASITRDTDEATVESLGEVTAVAAPLPAGDDEPDGL